jgi:hypothetical protein
MTSGYLLKPIRGRLELCRDISAIAAPTFRLESVFATAETLGITVFALHCSSSGDLLIDAVSENVSLLIGHAPEILTGLSPDSFLSKESKPNPFKSNSTALTPGRNTTCFPVLDHKNGTKLKCVVMLIRRPTPDAEAQHSFIALVTRSPNTDLAGSSPAR